MKFMQGRYGADHLSNFLMVFAMLLMIIGMITRNSIAILIFFGVAILILGFSYYRIFSKNHYKRYAENEKYLSIHNSVKGFLGGNVKKAKDRKKNHIFKCPGCGVKIRVPRGKGKIMITCPRCKHEFTRKS